MGIDLNLYVPEYSLRIVRQSQPHGPGAWSLSPLRCPHRDALFARIRKLPNSPLPDGHMITIMDTYQDKTTDGYGAPLRMVCAGDLAELPLGDEPGLWGPAVWAFLKALPPETPVVLYWC